MNKYITAALAVAFVGSSAFAKVANPKPMEMVQPDGTTITVKLYGDERAHCYVSADDGTLLMRQGDTFYYATLSENGELQSTNVLAHAAIARSSAESGVAKILDDNSINQLLLQRTQNSPLNKASRAEDEEDSEGEDTPENPYQVGLFPGKHYPAFGDQKGVAILVQYQDVEFTIENPHDFFYRMLNEEGHSDYGATGSAGDYFRTASSGQFTPTFDVYGPVTLYNDMAYYGGNNKWGNDQAPQYMAIHACQILDDEVDFSQYDCNGDGYIDNVYIFYAGRGEADGGSSDSVWPHSWDIPTKDPYIFDGVTLKHYACSNELQSKTSPDGVGTFLHEFSHVLGLPDLYSVAGTGGYTPNSYSIMDNACYLNDSRTPPIYGAFERNALGWTIPEVLENDKQYSLEHIQTSNKCYIAPVPESTTEFFLFENRQKDGWDSYLPGHGMLIWHIDYNEQTWKNNTVNDDSSHHGVDLEEADDIQSTRSAAGDPFPGTKNITMFTDFTSPSMCAWDGTMLNLPVWDIQENEGIISFKTGEEPSDGIADAIMGKDAVSTTYYDMQGREIAKPNAGIYVAKIAYSDGTVNIVKVALQ